MDKSNFGEVQLVRYLNLSAEAKITLGKEYEKKEMQQLQPHQHLHLILCLLFK